MLLKLKGYLTESEELNIILFKILGVGGVGISMISAVYSLLTQDLLSTIINFSAGVLAILLLYYVEKTRHYLVGYLIVEIAVFMVLFAVLYFTGSGIDGSMPYFFSFGLIFTFLMFEGRLLAIMESLLALFYFGVCVVSLQYPQLVTASGSSMTNENERIIGIFLPAFAMGLIFLLYIWEYKKQKQIAEEANRAKSIFLANMSHEIRTPVNAILGFNEITLRSATDDTVREYARYIDQSGHRLLNVINEILDFSRIESGKDEISNETFTLRDMAEEVKSLMSIMAEKKALYYELDYDENLCDTVYGDRGKIIRILTNLLSNAFKYTSAGSVILRIRQQQRTEDGQRIYFSVEDTGIGIRTSEIDNLFHAYERADLMKNRDIEGTGLGLAITEQLLHLLGSSIYVESTYGKGSCFYFELTLPEADPTDTAENAGSNHISFTAPNARILVVDDDEMNRRMMDSFLETYEITADFAAGSEECLFKYENNEYHLILMDYMMPGMDGASAMEKIRRKEENTGRRTPIIVLTADVTNHVDRELLERGFDDFLSKPIDFSKLEKVFLRYIPKELIMPETSEKKMPAPPRRFNECEAFLKESGICIEEGLKLVSGDSDQFLRIAEYFVKNTPADLKKLMSAADEKNCEELRLSLHSLKGKAGSIGAAELRKTAEGLELKCRQDDLEYVLCGLDLIVLQWKRCAEGLKQLLETEEQGTNIEFENDSPNDLYEELHKSLSFCEGKKARAAVVQIKQSEKESARIQVWAEIENLIDEMEFEKASEKLADLKKMKDAREGMNTENE